MLWLEGKRALEIRRAGELFGHVAVAATTEFSSKF